MRLSSFLFALLFSSAALSAQTTSETSQSLLLKLRAEASHLQPCPVRLTVDRRPQGLELWRVDSPKHAHPTQGLNISIENSANRIVAADVTVYGYSAGMRILPVGAPASKDASETRQMTETFHLIARAGESLLNSPVWTEHLTTVDRIVLTRIAYADGTEWQPSADSRCAATPSLLVLVSAAAR